MKTRYCARAEEGGTRWVSGRDFALRSCEGGEGAVEEKERRGAEQTREHMVSTGRAAPEEVVGCAPPRPSYEGHVHGGRSTLARAVRVAEMVSCLTGQGQPLAFALPAELGAMVSRAGRPPSPHSWPRTSFQPWVRGAWWRVLATALQSWASFAFCPESPHVPPGMGQGRRGFRRRLCFPFWLMSARPAVSLCWLAGPGLHGWTCP